MTDFSPSQQTALKTVRALLDLGHPLEEVLATPLVPVEMRDFVRTELERDRNFQLTPARTISANRSKGDWTRSLDRSAWHYWPELRQFLLSKKGFTNTALRSLEDSSDRILAQLAPPTLPHFDIRGLVLGYVQSGKTASYTALAAKAADAGYRLIVVLSGTDNGLRRQTNIRLKQELVGYADGRPTAVRLAPVGKQWHEFTRPDLNGDFQPGFANHAALQGSQPVLLVVKKNGPVLRRLLRWLKDAPSAILESLPVLVVDDEADQASVDTRGTYQAADDPPDPEYEPPSIINGLIRQLLNLFHRKAYVAYTATPFANILIPHDTTDPAVGNDLYPKDFIVDLPRPDGYFGAEELFGRFDGAAEGNERPGLGIVRSVSDADLVALEQGVIPLSLALALKDFVLAGAARARRRGADFPSTMLIHTSQLILMQAQLRRVVAEHFGELRDAWRYHRSSIRGALAERWQTEFVPVLSKEYAPLGFEDMESSIGPFIEAVQVREINSATGEVLDYEREPTLKAIAVGGNRLSRGLTLEGLSVSYFIRRSVTYDTVMQMGRWFGFRGGYEDLTRIYTTPELAGWFADLAHVEHRMREDLQTYESEGITPYEVGMRIWQHPTMQVTSPLKRRFASSTIVAQSYSLAIEQTFKFPLNRPRELFAEAQANLALVRRFLSGLGAPGDEESDRKGPVWTDVKVQDVLRFLGEFRLDSRVGGLSLPLIRAYIDRVTGTGELVRWNVSVRGRETPDKTLRTADWGLPHGPVNQVSRSRLKGTESLGVITSPGDETCGLSHEQREEAIRRVQAAQVEGKKKSENVAAREVRHSDTGLLLLYPISRFSGPEGDEPGARGPLYDDPNGPEASDLVAIALSFPKSQQAGRVEAFMEGTAGWRPTE